MVPRETENNAYAKFWGDKQRALWYVMVFLEWSICRRLSKKKTSFRKFRAGTAKKSDRKACVVLHVQSKQSNVLLVKTQGLNFAKAP